MHPFSSVNPTGARTAGITTSLRLLRTRVLCRVTLRIPGEMSLTCRDPLPGNATLPRIRNPSARGPAAACRHQARRFSRRGPADAQCGFSRCPAQSRAGDSGITRGWAGAAQIPPHVLRETGSPWPQLHSCGAGAETCVRPVPAAPGDSTQPACASSLRANCSSVRAVAAEGRFLGGSFPEHRTARLSSDCWQRSRRVSSTS